MSFMVYLFVWSPSPHIPYISSPNQCLFFRNTCSYHRNQFCCSINIISSTPSLSLNSLLGTVLYLNITHPSDYSHLCSLNCHLIFFPDRSGLTSCSILLSTQLLYSLPLLINDISLLVSNGTNCLTLFHPIWILASTVASASPFHTQHVSLVLWQNQRKKRSGQNNRLITKEQFSPVKIVAYETLPVSSM